MTDWPQTATRRNPGEVFAEAIRRGLIAPDGGAVWLYMFHDAYGVAHFRHVDHRAWMQMLPDEAPPADAPANDTRSCDTPADDSPADDIPADDMPDVGDDDAATSGPPDDGTPPVNDNRRKTGRKRP